MTDDVVLAALDALIAGFTEPPQTTATLAPPVAAKKPRVSNDLESLPPHPPHSARRCLYSKDQSENFLNLYTYGSEWAYCPTQGVQVETTEVARAEGLSLIDVAVVAESGGNYISLFSNSATFARLRRETMWHLDHGERVGLAICAGCRRFFGPGDEIFELADGNAVHITDDYACLIRHGERWRRGARRALGYPDE